MRPAPFKEKYEHSAPSGVSLVSSRHSSDEYSTEGETVVFGMNKEVLYKMPIFIGRRKVFLSPNGSVIVLDGSVYFGDGLLRTPDITKDEVVSSIYLNGKTWKDIHHATDLNDGKAIESNGCEFGGGWLSRKDYISDLKADWCRNVLIYKMNNGNGNDQEIELPPDHD
mmetsp:Transcript_21395/g.26463  ORF Transcript_21395/g.26463 Transcript_21395/m.26463 type:complete len:168 (+) Transcript_21395:64-567(+)